MGLFDIFKKTEPETAPVTEPKKEKVFNKYLDNLEKTKVIAALCAVPRAERDESWVSSFLADLPLAGFRCGTPQIIAGPDGFPYFQLLLPEPNTEFQCFVIADMIGDFLLERGYGVVINSGPGQPDWILSYGDILNYHLNSSFFTNDSLFSTSTAAEEIVTQGAEIMIGQPSETILPVQTRKLLKDFFELNGIDGPKVLLMMRKNGEELSQDLAFNITPEGFESETHYRNMMQTITWYLPRHYSIVGLHDDSLENGFMPL